MGVVFSVLNFLLWLYFVALIGRLVIEWVQVFSRDWRPRGVVLVIAEALFTVTDPAVRLLRRLIPPLRIGGASVDLSMLVLLLGISLLMNVTGALAR
ncbi:MAG: YggT family protein [Candidatus Lutibacillus vidarii]|jgi:YggT family protein|nr:YggT family protein [Candidatus Lutibacillus vidarii]HON75442.1 YggT family protein [Dermatophilaceae bacterium]HRB98939.1 YggT family protein [Dermatophilaceae bacterium]